MDGVGDFEGGTEGLTRSGWDEGTERGGTWKGGEEGGLRV